MYQVSDFPDCPLILGSAAGYVYIGDVPFKERFTSNRETNNLILEPGKRNFCYSPSWNYASVIEPDGSEHRIGQNGVHGFRDGPADKAQFGWGALGYKLIQLLKISETECWITDQFNKRIRRIHEQGGQWFVGTLIGGGNVTLAVNDVIPNPDLLSLSIGGPMSLAINTAGELFFYGAGLYRVRFNPDGTASEIARLPIPLTAGPDRPDIPYQTLSTMDADENGNIWCTRRETRYCHIWKIDPAGVLTWVAGLTSVEAAALVPDPIDGDATHCTFQTTGIGAIAPDARELYGGGGDDLLWKWSNVTGLRSTMRMYGTNSPPDWKANTAYVAGWIIKNGTSFYYKCTQPGTSGATKPVFSTPIGTITNDGSVIWTAMPLDDDWWQQGSLGAFSPSVAGFFDGTIVAAKGDYLGLTSGSQWRRWRQWVPIAGGQHPEVPDKPFIVNKTWEY